MASRVRATMPDDDANRSYPESSPDPLAASLRETKTNARRRTTRPSKEPLASSSPSKQNRRRSVSEQTIEYSSPSKQMVMNTGRTGSASPWRIKVTVQAEPGSGSDDENIESPTARRFTRTTTTTVPLKDADASSPVKRRGRPRKSDAATAKSKRSGTPARKRSQSKGRRRSSIGVTDASMADLSTVAVPKKRRGRPRKSIQATAEDETSIAHEAPTESLDENIAEPEPEPPQAPPLETPDLQPTLAGLAEERLQSSSPTIENTPQEPYVRPPHGQYVQQIRLDEPEHVTIRRLAEQRAEQQKLNAPTPRSCHAPRNTETSRKIKARKLTPGAKENIVTEKDSSDEEANPTPSTSDEEGPVSKTLALPAAPSLVEDISSIHETTLAQAQDSDEEDDLGDITNLAFDEGATRMPDDTVILESENFSMVSVDSLPSNGGLTSSANNNTIQLLDHSYLQIPSEAPRRTRSSPLRSPKVTVEPFHTQQTTSHVPSSPPVLSMRKQTPMMDERSPSNPPTIQPAYHSPSKTTTPRLTRVVKAGVALQGVLDPGRLTPTAESSEEAIDEQRDRLDDLFRGFSEGTRRELQAGLRLGEQLARHNQERKSRESSPALSSPCKMPLLKRPGSTILESRYKHRNSRMLTPDEQDYVLSVPPSPEPDTEVKYPLLRVNKLEHQLVSPARSEDEMSWRVDTPPPRAEKSDSQHLIASNEAGLEFQDREIVAVSGAMQREDYSDIWQEEASRSSDLPMPSDALSEMAAEPTPQLQDLFIDDDQLVKPARGKIPRTWRRKSSSDFNYSDEAEPPENNSSATSPEEPASTAMNNDKTKVVEPIIFEEPDNEDDSESETSDDTGMFFQSNPPNIFRKGTTERRRRRSDKLDLSLLMEEGVSIQPESSPAAKTPIHTKPNPFKGTPPQFARLQTSPAKSSPLRYEIQAPDTENSHYNDFDESTLPLSSPFRTNVDDTVASHELQFRAEMEGTTDSSLRRVRDEADERALAYETQERTLNEIEEVTEPSRTFRSTMLMPSSPPQVIEDSILAPQRTYPPLFGNMEATATAPIHRTSLQASSSPTSVTSPVEQAPQPQRPGLFSRLSSTLWNALGSSGPPPPHPATNNLDSLPKVEPWTKTHYKTLDKLYQLHKKQPTIFLPSSPMTVKNANNVLLTHFLHTQKHAFVGARFSSWGYSVTMSESLLVLCAVFMQLLTLKDIEEYEKVNRKEIQMGECSPGEAGTEFDGLCVATRLASVIMGEELRRDEKRGKIVRKVGGMDIEWPN
ncbi:hypothetical protein CC78DRAFT_157719 [Lojkania enalia]|uniref:AT DNA binding protein n=1 Tax=Lojkania enalia TaxID=147567 RepID=A0A9P4MXA0_9PLEO|nr:hypothetical protein CC78DRAFT_157719 [Didymosphaeria enalia]